MFKWYQKQKPPQPGNTYSNGKPKDMDGEEEECKN